MARTRQMPGSGRRFASIATVLAIVGAMLLTATGPASATTGWDPQDQKGVFDLRWAGAYQQDAQTIRVGIRLWHPLLRTHFLDHPQQYLELSMNPTSPSGVVYDWDGYVHPRTGGGWVAIFSYQGEDRQKVRVTHPSGTLFRVFLDASWASGEQIAVMTNGDAIDLVAP
jgi:hypothetical protein